MVKKLKDKKDILKAFAEISSWKTIKQISKDIGLSYQPTYTYLAEFSEQGILKHKKEGNIHLYSLNLKNRSVIREIENIEFDPEERQERDPGPHSCPPSPGFAAGFGFEDFVCAAAARALSSALARSLSMRVSRPLTENGVEPWKALTPCSP